MKDNAMKTSFLVILTFLSFQIYAKDTNDFLIISDKNRLERLEKGVAKLGAEREHARNIKQEHHDELQNGHNIIYRNKETTRIISDKERLEKLEQGVSNLGAERERARIISRGAHYDTETRHNTHNLNNRTIQSIANKERLEKLERGVLQLGAKRERDRIQIQKN